MYIKSYCDIKTGYNHLKEAEHLLQFPFQLGPKIWYVWTLPIFNWAFSEITRAYDSKVKTFDINSDCLVYQIIIKMYKNKCTSGL